MFLFLLKTKNTGARQGGGEEQNEGGEDARQSGGEEQREGGEDDEEAHAPPVGLDEVVKDMKDAIEKRAVEPVMKRPAASPTATLARVDHRRPKLPRPGTPVLHLGGRVYDDGKRLRCFRQVGDRHEKRITYQPQDRAEAFAKAFDEIENDPRQKQG